MDSIQAFDALFTTNHIQMLKLLLPCLPPDARRSLAIYIKAAELRYTLEFLTSHPFASLRGICGECQEPPAPAGVLASLLPFCTPQEKEKLQNMQSLFRNMENMQEMMQIMESLREIMPEFAADDLLKGFADGGVPDLTQIIELLNNVNGGTPASAE